MFGFIDKLKTKRQVESASDAQTYRKLIHKAATSGDLNATDTNDIERAAKALAIPLDKIEGDVQIAKRAIELEKTASNLEKLAIDHKEAGRIANNAVTDADKSRMEWQAKMEETQKNRAHIGMQRQAAYQASQELNNLRTVNPMLFGDAGELGLGTAGKP